MLNIPHYDVFVNRHIGPNDQDVQKMLNDMDLSSLDDLIVNTVPDAILLENELQLDEHMSEQEFLKHLSEITAKNKVFKNSLNNIHHITSR